LKYKVNIKEGKMTVDADDPIDAIIKARAGLYLMKNIPCLTQRVLDELVEEIRAKKASK